MLPAVAPSALTRNRTQKHLCLVARPPSGVSVDRPEAHNSFASAPFRQGYLASVVICFGFCALFAAGRTEWDTVGQGTSELERRGLTQRERAIRARFGTESDIVLSGPGSPYYSVKGISIRLGATVTRKNVLAIGKRLLPEYEVNRSITENLVRPHIQDVGNKLMLTFQQEHAGLDVWRGRVVMLFSRDRLVKYTSLLYDVKIALNTHDHYRRDFARVFSNFKRQRNLSAGVSPQQRFPPKLCILPEPDFGPRVPRVAWQLRVYDDRTGYFKDVFLSAETGEVLRERNAMAKSSTVYGRVTGSRWLEDTSNEPPPSEPESAGKGWPVSESVVEIEDREATTNWGTRTDKEGRYSFRELQDGKTYRVKFHLESFRSMVRTYIPAYEMTGVFNVFMEKRLDNESYPLSVDWGAGDFYGIPIGEQKMAANLFWYMERAEYLSWIYAVPYKLDDVFWEGSSRVMWGVWDYVENEADGETIWLAWGDVRASHIYHEYAHNLMWAHIGGAFIESLTDLESPSYIYGPHASHPPGIDEALADVISCLFRNNPNMWGLKSEWYGCSRELHPKWHRHLDNTLTLAPRPHWVDERYIVAEVLGGALLDLYKIVGSAAFNQLVWPALIDFVGSHKHLTIPEWIESIHLTDDDDEDMANGTPHCEAIYTAFYINHGLDCPVWWNSNICRPVSAARQGRYALRKR